MHLEGCIIEDDALVGSGSVVLHRCRVHSHSLVGANAVVTNDTDVPSHAMALGIPAKIFADKVGEGEFLDSVNLYVENAKRYKTDLRRVDS